MTFCPCRKAAGLVAGAAAAAGLPHAALLYSHDALGTALQHQYATVLDSKRRSLRRRMPAGAAEPEVCIFPRQRRSRDGCGLAGMQCGMSGRQRRARVHIRGGWIVLPDLVPSRCGQGQCKVILLTDSLWACRQRSRWQPSRARCSWWTFAA